VVGYPSIDGDVVIDGLEVTRVYVVVEPVETKDPFPMLSKSLRQDRQTCWVSCPTSFDCSYKC
jgi:hypothetical protein